MAFCSLEVDEGLRSVDSRAVVGDLYLTSSGAGVAAGARAVDRTADVHIGAAAGVGGWGKGLGVVAVTVKIHVAVTCGG